MTRGATDLIKTERRGGIVVDKVCERPPASRRESERTVIQSAIELKVGGMEAIVGKSRDVSTRGICFEADTPLPEKVKEAKTGAFRLLSDHDHTLFPCELVRVAGSVIIMTLLPGHEAKFVDLMRQEVVQEKGRDSGVLDLKMPDLPPEGHTV